MEVMDISLDKFYRMIYKNGKDIPEDILGKIAEAVSINIRYLLITFCSACVRSMCGWGYSYIESRVINNY